MKKIMFSERYGLTQAVLEGKKTMTRRIINGTYETVIQLKNEGSFIGKTSDGDSVILPQPTYKIGEEVAIAQSYNDVFDDFKGYKDKLKQLYKNLNPTKEAAWNNKMFVKASMMPHRIRITDIKVERLQDISEADIMQEGIMKGEFMNTWDRYYYDWWGDVPNHITFRNPQLAYESLIDRVCGKGTWDSNPWVVAYQFHLQRAHGFPK